MAESKLVDTLARLPAQVDAIVVHPDVIDDPTEYRRLGPRLVLENMDSRKPGGRTADELAPYSRAARRRALPRCRPCGRRRPVPAGSHELLDRYACRLRHLHVSSLDADGHHVPLRTTTSRPSGRSCVAAATCRGSWKHRWRLERLAVRAGAPRRPRRGRAAAPARRAGADRRRGARAARALRQRRSSTQTSRSSCSAPGAAAS